MHSRVFVSYRRDDSQGSAGRLYDRLVKTLGKNAIFFDIENISPGFDFVDVLKEQVNSCSALLAIIGAHWISSTNSDGYNRLQDIHDFVRIEIEAALERRIPVIPVLVDGAKMPLASELPDSLHGLVRRQAVEVSHARFNFDADRLFKGLRKTVEEFERVEAKRNPFAPRAKHPRLRGFAQSMIGAAVALSSVSAVILIWYLQSNDVLPHQVIQPVPAARTTPSTPTAPPPPSPSPSPLPLPDPKPRDSDTPASQQPYTQAQADQLCSAFNYQDLLDNQKLGIDQIVTFRNGLRSKKWHFSVSMDPSQAAETYGFGSVFQNLYGYVVELERHELRKDPNKIHDSIKEFTDLIDVQEKFLKLILDTKYSAAITYVFLYDQGLCNYPYPPRIPTADQMIVSILDGNLNANFSDEAKMYFKKVYDMSEIITQNDIKNNSFYYYSMTYYFISNIQSSD